MVDTIANQSFFINQAHFASDRMAGSVPKWNHSASPDTENTSKSSLIGGNNAIEGAPAPRLSFGELLDVVNPLHHLPVVGSVYRNMTGDEISSVARIAGGAIYGGPIGAAASIASAAIEEHSGKDIVGNILDTDKTKTYTFEDEPRMAGLEPKTVEPAEPTSEIAPIQITHAKKPEPEVIKIKSTIQPDQDVLDTLPAQQPITKVKIAEAITPPPTQKWNFNA